MGSRITTWQAVARAGALAVSCLALAHCSGPVSTRTASYPERVVEEGEPVPKGGGSYKLGKPYNLNGRTYVPQASAGYRAEGVASWYGRDFHGRLTANREVYDMNGISAAHPTMPLPSYARVTNLSNGHSIIVRVNNRGPYAHDRIIDLSVGTAKALDFHGKGLARVRVEYVGRAPVEGNDDGMLLATLRHGTPAPAPSKVMLAGAKPLVSETGPGRAPVARATVAARSDNETVGSIAGEGRADPSLPTSSWGSGFFGFLRGEPGPLNGRGLY
jgi:rare lipoprotein A